MNNSVHKKAKNINRQFTGKYKWLIAKHEKMFYYCYIENTKKRNIFAGMVHLYSKTFKVDNVICKPLVCKL